MSKKRTQWVVATLSLLAGGMWLAGCGGGGVAEARRLQQEQIRSVEKYLAALDRADNAKAVASAIDAYADDVERLAPRMKRLLEKHPEWKQADRRPKELQAEDERAKAAFSKMAGAMFKAMPYMGDPEVRTAQERLMKAMQLMAP